MPEVSLQDYEPKIGDIFETYDKSYFCGMGTNLNWSTLDLGINLIKIKKVC